MTAPTMSLTPQWVQQAILYHIFPLGALGAEIRNPWVSDDTSRPPLHRIRDLVRWIPHLQQMGVNTLLLGPIWNSESHGYDTVELGQPDPRLGSREDYKWTFSQFKKNGFRLVLDAVFNHVGRHFPKFQSILQLKQQSPWKHWFSGLDFKPGSPYGDDVFYDTWDGHWKLVKLRLDQSEVRQYLLDQVGQWIAEYEIDGLRLDAADTIDPAFWPLLRSHTSTIKPDFWLFGEQVFGDYRNIAGPQSLHGTTNYECYKGFWSSANETNMHEVAHSLKRQYQDPGIYNDLVLVNFLDNHDVDRIASKMRVPSRLYPLHILLLTLPGVPALYYGSEFGLLGTKEKTSDWPLRPHLDPAGMHLQGTQPNLPQEIQRLTTLRYNFPALTQGSYREIGVGPDWLVFERTLHDQTVVVAISISPNPQSQTIALPKNGCWKDVLNGDTFEAESSQDGKASKLVISIPACWGRVLLKE